jgi:very-short-patch-repair endonuclease/predicted transcriptional regulator of viral defense system
VPDVCRETADCQPKSVTRPGDRTIADLAGRQHGVVAHRQLRALGVGEGAIRYRIASGRLHRVHAGVYAVGHRVLSASGIRLAAVLACGPGAVLSHRDAAALWGLRPCSRMTTDVTTAGGARSRPGIEVHRVKALYPDDCTTEDHIPTTTVARTLLDLAEVTRHKELERAFERADQNRLLDLSSFDALFARSKGRHGLGATRAVLRSTAAADTQSELEVTFLRFCRTHGIPGPQTNVLVEGFVVDALWPDQRVIVELDGYAFHGTTRAAFERDRARDAALQRAGYRVIRLTWRRLHAEPEVVAATLHALLASIAAPWRTT